VAIQSYWIARHYRFKRDLVNMPEGVEVHVLPAGPTPRMRFNDFTHTGTLIDLAYAASSAYLDDRAAGLPVPSIDEALCQVQSSYEPDEAAEAVAAAPGPDPSDSRWRRTVAAARRRDRAAAGAPDNAAAVGAGDEVGADGGAEPVPAADLDLDLEPAAELAISEDPSRWRRAVGIARRERHAAEPGRDEPAPLDAASGLSTAHAVGARVAKILSRGDA
jgi:hypothetical protein